VKTNKKVRRCSLRHQWPLGVTAIKIRTGSGQLLFEVSSNSRRAVQACTKKRRSQTIRTHPQTGTLPHGWNKPAATAAMAHKLIVSKFPSSLQKVKCISRPDTGTLAELSALS